MNRSPMDKITFVVGRQEYVAELKLDEEHVSVTLSVSRSGDDRSLLDISWVPKTKWQRFVPNEDLISINVVNRALRIWEDFRKTAASKTLHKRKPKPAPKKLDVLRKQIKESMARQDHERTDALVVEFKRLYANTLVRLPLAEAGRRP